MKVEALVEIPMDSIYKYEKNKLDRVLNQSIPYNYGYIPGVQAADGDELDIFILSDEPIWPGITCEVNIVGGFECLDNDVRDDKLIGVLKGEDHDVLRAMMKVYSYLTTYKKNFLVLGELSQSEIEELLK